MLRALHRTARVIQEEQPDFPGTFRMPARSAHGVLMAARLAIRDLKAVAQVFINPAIDALGRYEVSPLQETMADLSEAIGEKP